MNFIDGHPRRDFERERYELLNGEWEFCFDDKKQGESLNYPSGRVALDQTIVVPFVYQSAMSGIGDTAVHETVWYRRSFIVDRKKFPERVLLKFGAVDYLCTVWVNGTMLGTHRGGYTPFAFDITSLLAEENTVVVKVVDSIDQWQPRGKQYWKEQPDRCWYVASTGIWQSVWLEGVGENTLKNILITPDIDRALISVEMMAESFMPGDTVEIEISYREAFVKRMEFTPESKYIKCTVDLLEEDYIDEIHCWSPECPNLYDAVFTLKRNGRVTDTVKSYFGMRKVSWQDGGIFLNNKPMYQKLILDQGYWEESDLTPPTEEAIRQDILLTKEMGFNGARKHQKIEDPRYYYWADVLGLLVWAEMPSGYCYNAAEVGSLTAEYQEVIARDYNHPSIIAWVPLNESWGIRKALTSEKQKHFIRTMYHLTKSLDTTRFISANDGWENGETDIVSIHDYAYDGKDFAEKYAPEKLSTVYPMARRLFGIGEAYKGQPVMVTEYGGIALVNQVGGGNWGYCGAAKNAEELLQRYSDLTLPIMRMPWIAGFCYTQLTDVKQEVNGLLDVRHKPKFDTRKIRQINDGEPYRI